jgi:tripartite-type tricarboxylate transporter receptor subunit TctC
MMLGRPASRRVALAALLCLAAPAAYAQTGEGLFAKKTITIFIGNTAGGSYDLYGRLVSRHLGKHLPGNPTVIASNMPGAGTLKAANFIYSAAPKDGTAIGIVTETLALEQAVSNPAVQFDATKFLWVGRAASSNNIHFQWHTAKVQSIEEAKKTESAVAAAGAGNISEVVPKLLNAVIGTKFKVISGYPASAEGMLAMERGEVEGTASSWASVKVTRQQWLAEKKIKIILQDVPTSSKDLPDVPALGELGDNADDKAILGLYASGGAVGRAFMLPPGTQPAAVKALQEGFAAMMKDPEFLAEADKANLEIDYSSPEALEQEMRKTLGTQAQVIARAKAIFGR